MYIHVCTCTCTSTWSNETTNKATQYNTTQQHPRQLFFPKKNELPQVGFEPTTLCSLDRVLFHWATEATVYMYGMQKRTPEYL